MGTRWILRIGCAALLALLPFAGMAPWLIAAALLPLMCTAWRARQERLCPTLCLVAFALGGMCRVTSMPAADLWYHPALRLLILQLALCVPCAMMIWCPGVYTRRTGFGWLMLQLACACVAPLLVPGGMVLDEIMALLDGWDGLNKLLVSLYGQRILQEFTLQQRFALQMLGVLDEGMRHQLLLSLALYLQGLLKTMVPQVLVGYSVGMTALCMGAWDGLRSKRTGWRDYPEPVRWHLPRGTGLRVGLLWLGNAVPFFTDDSAAVCFGVTCAAVFTTVYAIQGCLMLWWWLREKDFSGVMSAVCIALAGLLLPFVLTLAGLYDQSSDPRGLRKSQDEGDGDPGP